MTAAAAPGAGPEAAGAVSGTRTWVSGTADGRGFGAVAATTAVEGAVAVAVARGAAAAAAAAAGGAGASGAIALKAWPALGRAVAVVSLVAAGAEVSW